MFKEIREVITGGEEFASDRAKLEFLKHKPHLTRSEKSQYAALEEKVSRRLFISRGVAATASGVATLGFGLQNLEPVLDIGGIIFRRRSTVQTSSTKESSESAPGADSLSSDKADKVRQQIKNYESLNSNRPANGQDVIKVFHMIDALYKETFRKETVFTRITVRENNREIPLGDFYYDSRSGYDIAILMGRPNKNDPSLTQLAAYRGLVLFLFTQAQALPRIENKIVTLGANNFQSIQTLGLRWFTLGSGANNEVGGFFENLNTQIIAEDLNDPTGRDDLFVRMRESPLYRHSLAPIFQQGAQVLRKIYSSLGISTQEIEVLRYHSQPEELLQRIDGRIESLGIPLVEPASVTLIRLNPRNFQSNTDLKPLYDLLVKLPKAL